MQTHTQDNKGRLRSAWEFAKFFHLTFIAPWPPIAFLLLGTALAGAASPIVIVYVTRRLIDDLTAGIGESSTSMLDALAPHAPWLGLLVFIRLVDHYSQMGPFHYYLGYLLNDRSRRKFDPMFFRRALTMRLEWFEYPEYHDALERGREPLEDEYFTWTLRNSIQFFAKAFSILGMMVAISGLHWTSPLLLAAGGFVIVWSHWVRARRIVNVHWTQTPAQRRQEYMSRLLTERGPAAEVRLFGLGRHVVDYWRRLMDRVLTERMGVRRQNVRTGVPSILITTAILGAVMLTLILQGANGALTAGALVAYIYVTLEFVSRLNDVGWRIQVLHEWLVGLTYLQSYLSIDKAERVGGAQAARSSPEVVFEGVSFTYPGGRAPVLSDIDLRIGSGERVALVGENGAGKTTLAKVLLGLYQPTGGVVRVNGVDLEEIERESWRQLSGAVFQDHVRYSFTVRENIVLGSADGLDDERLRRAAEMSGVDEFALGLPDGFDTPLGKEFEDGHELSGGQWQALAIARLYFRDARLLVLDEPTASLDALAELEVYRQLLGVAGGRTVLLVSHRLGSARLADRVIYLKDGRITEQGTHDELVSGGGEYAEMFAAQAEWYR